MLREQTTTIASRPSLRGGASRIRLAAPADAPKSRVDAAQPVILIGSRRDCDLFIEASDVSKVHCAIVNDGSTVVAADLCSRSGTFVNGVALSGPTRLRPGDELRVGSVAVTVEFDENRDARESAGVELDTPLLMDGAEQRHELTTLPAVIGRRQACQVVLDTPDVSLTHALVFLIDGCPAVCDLGSRSGTVLNSERIDLAWLGDGDHLCIGGEELTVQWQGPQFHVEGAAAKAAGALIAAPPIPVNMGSLEDIGAMIDGLRAQIDSSQAGIRNRAAELDQREAELDARARELEQKREETESRRGEFENKRDELKLLAAGIKKKHETLKARQAGLEKEREELLAERQAFEQERAQYESTVEDMMSRESELCERHAALEARESELASREAALARREAEAAEIQSRIEQFKSALGHAQQAFGSAASGGAASSPSPAPPPEPPQSSSSDNSRPDSEFPAPLVDNPIFGAAGAAITADWTPEMVDRLNALRRVNGQADVDLISQVQAEFASQRAAPPHAETKKKRKRRWLS